MEMKKLSDLLWENGGGAFFQMKRIFRKMDSDGNKVLSLKELTDGIRELGLQADAMSDAEIKAVFEALDFSEKDGSLTYAELVKAVTPPMSQAREDIVAQAFAKLDKTKDGVVSLDDLKGNISYAQHPDCKSGAKTEEQLLTEFLNIFEPDAAFRDGTVTLDEFNKYYAILGNTIKEDEQFISTVKDCWGL